MKKTIYFNFSLLLVLACVLGCHPTKKYVVKVGLTKITPENMFDRDVINDYLFDAEELNMDSLRTASHKLFLGGIDLYKNKKKPADAVALFEQSLLVFPDAKTYYELANALMDAHNNPASELEDARKNGLKDAMSAIEIAEELNFKPSSMIYYDEACISYMRDGIDSDEDRERGGYEEGWPTPIEYLNEAFQNGFNDTNMLKKDKRINMVLKTRSYKRMRLALLAADTGAKSHNFFEVYKKAFPVISQPFSIGVGQVDMKDYDASISYDFAEFIPEMGNTEFGRGVSNDYFYVGKVAETPLYTALIYTSTSYEGEYMQPVYTKLVTYTSKGKIIDARIFSCQASPEKIKTGKIENNEITLEDFKRTWKYPIERGSFDSNKVVKYESLAKAVFLINDSGRIVQKSVPANYKDSSLAILNSNTKNKQL